MEQYISKDAVVAEIEKQIELGKFKCQQSQENNDRESYVAWSEHIATCGKIFSFISALEVKEDNIIVPRWFLENVENTLRIQNNINIDKKSGETCQDRNIRGSLNGVRKLLNGKELTGMERLEKQGEQKPTDKIEPENTPIEGKFPYNNSSDTLENEIENIWGKLSCQGLFTATKEGFSEVATHFANYLKK